MTDFLRSPRIGTSSECRNEPKIHNTDWQCYEFWVHSGIPSSFQLAGNDEKSVFKSPFVYTITIRWGLKNDFFLWNFSMKKSLLISEFWNLKLTWVSSKIQTPIRNSKLKQAKWWQKRARERERLPELICIEHHPLWNVKY